MSAEANNNKNTISISKSNIKTPLELQLWYDLVRKTGGAQSQTCCPTVGTENNVKDFDEDFDYNSKQLTTNQLNIDLTIDEQNRQTICDNISEPLIPLITELGVSNEKQNSN